MNRGGSHQLAGGPQASQHRDVKRTRVDDEEKLEPIAQEPHATKKFTTAPQKPISTTSTRVYRRFSTNTEFFLTN